MFWKKKNKVEKRISKDFVEIEGKKVFFYELTNGIRNKVYEQAVVNSQIINMPLYYSLFEQELLPFTKQEIDNLTIVEGDLIRKKVQEILSRNGLVSFKKKEEVKEDQADIFANKDIDWFNKTKNTQLNKLRGVKNA